MLKTWAAGLACFTLVQPLWGEDLKSQTGSLPLPDAIRSTLNEEYPGWKLAPVTPQVLAAYKQHKIAHSPSIAAGDFNLDGQRDYAVQIVLKTPGQEEQFIIVFLGRSGHYEETILQSMGIDANYSLWVKKTTLDETGSHPDKPVTKDVLLVLGGPVGDTVYSCDQGKFHEIGSPEDSEHPDLTIPRAPPPPDAPPEKMEP